MNLPRLFLVALAVLVAAGLLSCAPCRSVEARALDFACAPNAFTGEIHLDSGAVFESFLGDRCLPDATPEEILEIVAVAAVDFQRDAVLVSSGLRSGLGRCVATRKADSVAVCSDGLRIIFDDTLADIDEAACSGTWTVAVVLPRTELRAALQAHEDVAL